MNTSLESYRIQTYAEYVKGKHQNKEKLGQTPKSWGEDGWRKPHYASATSAATFGYPRGLRKRSISPVQGSADAPVTDGWSNYSYPDSAGSKKMKTDDKSGQANAEAIESKTRIYTTVYVYIHIHTVCVCVCMYMYRLTEKL
ncbi:poly(A)-specific ribonuclease PARN-like isoform X1 [Cyclopterus lumpus]|uniref:poly(A)-specific ribonuclease PARN-like isoform X1 n=1 Tax=Cyclopterus lumpus TaxID=8103 RepID=UPI0014860D07|nr:poly(A)-specific ribonuclease PARN-like isoform X1 [Cyclopterus lumpus]